MPAKNDAPDTGDNTQTTAPDSFDLTLKEFCTRLSKTDKSVEMIAGFNYSETQAGRLKDSEGNFMSRYAAFQTQPA